MDDLYLDFRDALIELVDKDSSLDYTPVREDEGFVTLDELACHYLHQEDKDQETISIYFLNPTETIREKHGCPEHVYCLDGASWSAVPSGKTPNVSSQQLANLCIKSLIKLNGGVE
jgi:hypothetical protein